MYIIMCNYLYIWRREAWDRKRAGGINRKRWRDRQQNIPFVIKLRWIINWFGPCTKSLVGAHDSHEGQDKAKEKCSLARNRKYAWR